MIILNPDEAAKLRGEMLDRRLEPSTPDMSDAEAGELAVTAMVLVAFLLCIIAAVVMVAFVTRAVHVGAWR